MWGRHPIKPKAGEKAGEKGVAARVYSINTERLREVLDEIDTRTALLRLELEEAEERSNNQCQ